MVPAVGVISLAWVMLCLFSQSNAQKTSCCNCANLQPHNAPPGSTYQIMPSPFKIEVNRDYYRQGPVKVKLVATGGEKFTSFMLGAYKFGYHYNSDKNPIGKLSLLNTGKHTVVQDCTTMTTGTNRQTSYALKNGDEDPKDLLEFLWTPNSDTKGHIEFRATFIKNDKTYWVSEKSKILEDPDSSEKRHRSSYIPAIDTSECGYSKGCFREPADCSEPQCLYVMTWKEKSTSTLEIELGGLAADGASDRYVAVGISDDKYMGEDTVFTCAHSSIRDTTEVYASYNEIDPKRNIHIKKYENADDTTSTKEYRFLESEEGSYRNGRLRCRFIVNKALGLHTSDMLKDITGENQHLLFSHGFASRGAPNDPWMKYEDPPGASEQKVDLTSENNYSGWASYPLAKAHAILMILAWILCNSIGMLLSKYYTKMWPNKEIHGRKYWYIGHFNLLALTFIITIISIIIIYVETGGYSEAPDLPLKAHPILGFIILACILIIPIIAFLRPSEPGNCQNIFNWFYWAFCTIANVLAIPNIFIGMDFGKVGVPWWATWILVIWVIFHIVVELTLEIHQCCTHKKNKEKRKKYEQLKKEYPKQNHPLPELAGRRFKRFMLSLHIGITILITLIMVIIIAVS